MILPRTAPMMASAFSAPAATPTTVGIRLRSSSGSASVRLDRGVTT